MYAILWAAAIFIADLFKSRRRLRAENLLLRHQLAVALRRVPPRRQLSRSDRAVLFWITRLYPELLGLDSYREAGDHPTLASDGVSGLLALEVGEAGRADRRLTAACET